MGSYQRIDVLEILMAEFLLLLLGQIIIRRHEDALPPQELSDLLEGLVLEALKVPDNLIAVVDLLAWRAAIHRKVDHPSPDLLL